MADGGIGNQSPATLFQARLDTSDGISSTLTLKQHIGNKVVVSGITVPIPAIGLTRLVTDNLIDATGGDAGGPPAGDTLYYVYISNKRASFSPESIRLSAQPPTLVNGVKYLGTTGNALNWRFVGWVFTNSTPQFMSTAKRRFIINYYNRLALALFNCPGYVDDNAYTTYNVTNGTWQAIKASESVIEFIANGEDAAHFSANVWAQLSDDLSVGIGINVTTSPSAAARIRFNNAGIVGAPSYVSEGSVDFCDKLVEGYSFASLLATGGGTQVVYSDAARDGATADPPLSYITGTIQG